VVVSTTKPAAFGGPGWVPREASMREDLGTIWAACGVSCEWTSLRDVLLHRPGDELAAEDPNAALMLERPAPDRVRAQHDALAAAYRAEGVTVHYVDPWEPPPPNQVFVADTMLATPEGVIVGRPASHVRAREVRWVARRLAELGVPILRTVAGTGTFEGADALWLNPGSVLLGRSRRTNEAGAAQVAATLRELGADVVQVDVDRQAMHLMGAVRFLDGERAVVWPGRVTPETTRALRDHGYQVLEGPDPEEALRGAALNFVTLAPGRIVMPARNPVTERFFEAAGVDCVTVEVDELAKAAGAIGCSTGILRRDSPA
jgi:arginine deiminase